MLAAAGMPAAVVMSASPAAETPTAAKHASSGRDATSIKHATSSRDASISRHASSNEDGSSMDDRSG